MLTDNADDASLATIIGIAAAVLVIVIGAVVAFIFYRRRSQKKRWDNLTLMLTFL